MSPQRQGGVLSNFLHTKKNTAGKIHARTRRAVSLHKYCDSISYKSAGQIQKLSVAVAFLEFVDPAAGIYKLLLARKERMAFRTDVDFYVFFS